MRLTVQCRASCSRRTSSYQSPSVERCPASTLNQFSGPPRCCPTVRPTSLSPAGCLQHTITTNVFLKNDISCACWFTSRFLNKRRNISQTFWHRLPLFQVDLLCTFHRVATSLCRGHVDESATEPCLLLDREHGTGSADGAETAAIDGLVSSWSENISVSFCLRAPGYGLTLLCAFGLLVGGAISVTVTVTVNLASTAYHLSNYLDDEVMNTCSCQR